mmetsp:Transcript_59940/g.125355  ORF Transcript_59940/g.125355 Transcript_59940/m.125355 type:complete len:281 (+) Transcript_59940:136-978(+)
MWCGSTAHAFSERKGPKERWLMVWETSIVSQLNWWLSDAACILSIPGARCTCTSPDTMQPTPLCESTLPSISESTTLVRAMWFFACARKFSAHAVIAGTDRSPWNTSCSDVPVSSLRKTRMVGKASTRCFRHSTSPPGAVQSTFARKRRSSPGYFWARVAVLFSQTGSRRWHQWHQGAKKLTIMIWWVWWWASKVSSVSSSVVMEPSCTSSVLCWTAGRSGCSVVVSPALFRCTFWTRAAISASCVPIKLVTSTLAYSHFSRWNVMLMLIWRVSSVTEVI